MPKVPKTINLQYHCNISRKTWKINLISSDCWYHFRCVWPGMPKLPKITSLQFLCNVSSEKWVMKLIFYIHINMKVCYKLIWFWWRWSSIPKVSKTVSLQCLYNISKNKLEMKLIFCMQVNIKVSEKLISTLWVSKFPTGLILSLLMDIIKLPQITQSNKFAISLQHLRKEVRNGGHFWHAGKLQNFCKLVLSFLVEVARHAQNT